MGNLNFPLRSAHAHFWNAGRQSAGCTLTMFIRRRSQSSGPLTWMVVSSMDSCLYCVPYHSSVLSVWPSYDFDTTATLQRSEPGHAMFTTPCVSQSQRHPVKCFLLALHWCLTNACPPFYWSADSWRVYDEWVEALVSSELSLTCSMFTNNFWYGGQNGLT